MADLNNIEECSNLLGEWGASGWRDGEDAGPQLLAKAQVHATLAQVELLDRIATALERIAGTEHRAPSTEHRAPSGR